MRCNCSPSPLPYNDNQATCAFLVVWNVDVRRRIFDPAIYRPQRMVVWNGVRLFPRIAEMVHNFHGSVRHGSLPISFTGYVRRRISRRQETSSQTETPQRQHDNNPRQMQKEKRNAKIMAFVLLLFVIFWFPFLATSLLKYLPFSQDVFEIAKNFALTLAMTNSMCNPVVYCWLKDDFRRAFNPYLTHGFSHHYH